MTKESEKRKEREKIKKDNKLHNYRGKNIHVCTTETLLPYNSIGHWTATVYEEETLETSDDRVRWMGKQPNENPVQQCYSISYSLH